MRQDTLESNLHCLCGKGKCPEELTFLEMLQVVPESVLRRRKTLAEVKEKREEILASQRVKRSNKPAAGVLFKKASAFVKDYRQKFASGTRFARETKKLRRVSTGDAESKLVLVIRHKAGKNLDSKTRKILHVLRLFEMHMAAFIKATPGKKNRENFTYLSYNH